jgi:tetratricopeptide (TPR) repeat protein
MLYHDSRYDHRTPDQVEEELKQRLPEAEAKGDREEVLRLLTQIARFQGLQQRFAEAHALLDQIEVDLLDDLRAAPIRLLIERGRLFNLARQRERALPLFLAAFEQAMASDLPYLAADAANMVAIVSPNMEDRITWNRKVVALAEQHECIRPELPSIQYNLGLTYSRLKRYEEALAMFERCVETVDRERRPELERAALASTAQMLRLLQRPAEALALLQRLAATGVDDGFIQEEIGECMLQLGRPAWSRPHFARAYHSLAKDPWVIRDQPGRLARLHNLGLR